MVVWYLLIWVFWFFWFFYLVWVGLLYCFGYWFVFFCYWCGWCRWGWYLSCFVCCDGGFGWGLWVVVYGFVGLLCFGRGLFWWLGCFFYLLWIWWLWRCCIGIVGGFLRFGVWLFCWYLWRGLFVWVCWWLIELVFWLLLLLICWIMLWLFCLCWECGCFNWGWKLFFVRFLLYVFVWCNWFLGSWLWWDIVVW